jgi:hypothetical protein
MSYQVFFEEVHFDEAKVALHIRLKRDLVIRNYFDPMLLDVRMQDFLGEPEILRTLLLSIEVEALLLAL